MGRVLSLVVVLAYAVLAVWKFGLGGLIALWPLLFPLALIWFAEEIGSVTGYFKSGYVNVQTPGVMVALMGWIFLLSPVIFYFIR